MNDRNKNGNKEIETLKEILKEGNGQNGMEQVFQAVRRINLLMTFGMDVSECFVEMIKAGNTNNIIQKKLVWSYLSKYAPINPQHSLLTISTFQKDFSDSNPIIRSLAIKSFSSLKLSSIVEYLLPMIEEGLMDNHPFVRRKAVLACIRLKYLQPAFFSSFQSPLVVKLYEMLRDGDHLVVSNCLIALDEIMKEKGGIIINRPIFTHVLHRLHEWEDSSCLPIIINILSSYLPSSSKEVFDLMNQIDDCLNHTNSSLTLSASSLFLKVTENDSKLHQQVISRIKIPLLTLLNRSEGPDATSIISHLCLLMNRSSDVLKDNYQHIFCKMNDSDVVKISKIKLLTRIAASSNYSDIIYEFGQYAKERNCTVSKESVNGLGEIFKNVLESRGSILYLLFELISFHADSSGQIIIILRDLLELSTEFWELYVLDLPKCIEIANSSEEKECLVFIIGELSQKITKSNNSRINKLSPAYMLETFVLQFNQFSATLKLHILDASYKIFFACASEMFPLLQMALSKSISDDNIMVRERAMQIYKLLSIISHPFSLEMIESKHEVIEPVESDRLFDEFNSLSVDYGKSSNSYISTHPMQIMNST